MSANSKRSPALALTFEVERIPSRAKVLGIPPQILGFGLFLSWGEEDSNLRSRTTTDLQSAPVGHFGISPEINNIPIKINRFIN